MSDITSIKIKKTRKPHKCNWCPEDIKVGESAVRVTMFDHGIFSHYLHIECDQAIDRLGSEDWQEMSHYGYEPHAQQRGDNKLAW